MPITSAAGLVDALRDCRILDASQLDMVTRALQGRSPEPRTVAGELIQRGWLTTFQANRLLQGRGGELLLGEYLLLDRLGEGGMGQVFKARHTLMGRTVAIKVIRRELLAYGDAVQRFQREIRLAAQLKHPHLVWVEYAAQFGDSHFLVMEYAEGIDLERQVAKSGPLAVGAACACIRQAALGLQHAHERGLVHRDVKPSNLQLTDQGATIKVLDMGLARSMAPGGEGGTAPELTQGRTIMGTPDFIAPEQIADPRRVDARADIYSLGCAFYFLLAGRPPFPEGSWEEKLFYHRQAEPTPIEQHRPELAPAVGAILRKMMAKDPADRYASAAAVAEALTPFCAMAGPAVAAMPAAGPQRPASPTGQAPAPGGSLVEPAAAYEPGWTVKAGSTVVPPPAPATTPPSASPFTQPTVLLAAPATAATAPTTLVAGPAAPPTHRRVWLIAGACGAILALAVALPLLLRSNDGPTNTATSTSAGSTPTTSRVEPTPGVRPADGGPPSGPKLGNGPDPNPASIPGPVSVKTLSVAFTPDGLHAVSQSPAHLYLWDLQKRGQAGNPLGLGSNAARPGGVAVAPDGKRVAALDLFSLVLFTFNGRTCRPDGPPVALDPRGSRVTLTGLAFSPDSSLLAVADANGQVRILSVETRQPKMAFQYQVPVFGVAFSHDGKFLYCGVGEKIRRWNLPEDRQEDRTFDGHEGTVTDVQFSADGKRLYSASRGDPAAGRTKVGSLLTGDGTVRVWNNDSEPGKLEQRIDPTRAVDDGRRPEPGKRGKGPGAATSTALTCVAFWPGGRALTGHAGGSVILWDLETGKELAKFPYKGTERKVAVTAAAISPDGHHALVFLSDYQIYLYRLPPPP
jgi:serine/threonine-protein kinase